MSDQPEPSPEENVYCNPDDIVLGVSLFPLMGSKDEVGALGAEFRQRDGSTCSLIIPRDVWDEIRLILADLDRVDWKIPGPIKPFSQMN